MVSGEELMKVELELELKGGMKEKGTQGTRTTVIGEVLEMKCESQI